MFAITNKEKALEGGVQDLLPGAPTNGRVDAMRAQ
jgi:hypothetical protein